MKIRFIDMGLVDDSKITIKEIVYMKSCANEKNYATWIKRDNISGFDVRVTDYLAGQFHISRLSAEAYSSKELIIQGYEIITEDEFNNAFIEASSWLLYNASKCLKKTKVKRGAQKELPHIR